MTVQVPEEEPPVSVREAVPGDLPAVRELVHDAGLPAAGLVEAAVVLAAHSGKAVVGAIALERHRSDGEIAFLLRSAVVAPAWRGRGVGTRLTAAALERVDATGAAVALLTVTAADYFPRFGFVPVDRAALPRALEASPELSGACPATALAMLRPA